MMKAMQDSTTQVCEYEAKKGDILAIHCNGTTVRIPLTKDNFSVQIIPGNDEVTTRGMDESMEELDKKSKKNNKKLVRKNSKLEKKFAKKQQKMEEKEEEKKKKIQKKMEKISKQEGEGTRDMEKDLKKPELTELFNLYREANEKLQEDGFSNTPLNLKLLKRFDGSYEKARDYLDLTQKSLQTKLERRESNQQLKREIYEMEKQRKMLQSAH